MKRIFVQGIGFDNFTIEEACDFAIKKVCDGEKCIVVTPNAEISYMAARNEEVKNILNDSDLVLPDGIGVVKGAKILNTPLKGKVAGIDFSWMMLSRFAERGIPVFLLGSKPGVAEKAANKIKERYPKIEICGVKDGYFKEDSEAVEAVNASGAKALFVALGAPKQEKFMHEHKDELAPLFMIGVGGSLDVISGNTKRAPDIFIKLGLEWFYRLLKEPSRIGRMMILPKFLQDVKKEKRSREGN